jgi:hypothetical protein
MILLNIETKVINSLRITRQMVQEVSKCTSNQILALLDNYSDQKKESLKHIK